MKNNAKAIGIDLGGTRIKAVLIDGYGQIIQETITQTDDKNGSWKIGVKQAFEQLITGNEDVSIGLSAPGIPNKDNTCIQYMPERLIGIEGFNWSTYLQKKVHVVNDAIAAMSAEAKFGAAKDCRDAIMITIGTGVGGALLINGKIHQGSFQKAGHIGHMSVNQEGEPDICGMPGSLEEAIGNYSIEKRSNGMFHSTAEMIEALKLNNLDAKTIWLKSVRSLAIAIASLGNIISPEKVILAGGITNAGEILTKPLKEYMASFEWKAGGEPMKIEIAHFGEHAGALGAAAFAMSANENNLS
jgi:glucokinase